MFDTRTIRPPRGPTTLETAADQATRRADRLLLKHGLIDRAEADRALSLLDQKGKK